MKKKTLKTPKKSPTKLKVPLYSALASCGFPSPAEDYVDTSLDLNEHLVTNKEATFFIQSDGDSMIGTGIYNKDLLIVDRSISPKNGSIVMASINGEFTIKRLKKTKTEIWLMPENDNYPPIQITDGMDFSIFGIVTYNIHKPK